VITGLYRARTARGTDGSKPRFQTRRVLGQPRAVGGQRLYPNMVTREVDRTNVLGRLEVLLGDLQPVLSVGARRRGFEIGQRLPNAAPIEPIFAVAAGVEVVVRQGDNEPGYEHVVGRPVPGAFDTHAEFVRAVAVSRPCPHPARDRKTVKPRSTPRSSCRSGDMDGGATVAGVCDDDR
jgi:hypothetical protein